MAYSGYPTPDNQTGDATFGCIPVFVPNNPEFNGIFASIIYGLYAQMANDYFWKLDGTMLPEQAAFLSARGLALTEAYAECGGSMSCDDIADCIETSSSVVNALIQQLSANGYSASGNNSTVAPVTLSPANTAENLLPVSYTCSDDQLMATARTIVQKFDEFTQDFFDQIELLTNPLELTDIVTDSMPGVSTTGDVAAFVDFMAQTLREFYQASYNNSAENELACLIYCAMKPDCELTHDMLVNVYSDASIVEYPSPSDLNDLQSIVDWLQGLDLAVGVATVAAFHLFMALAMKFGSGEIFEMSGLVGLKTIIAGTAGLLDTSWKDCDCAEETPTDYWMIYNDCRVGLGDFTLFRGTETPDGCRSATNGSVNNVQIRISDLGAAFQLKAAAVEVQRRGATGNGNDFNTMRGNTLANFAGVEHVVMNEGFIVDNTNDDYSGQIQVTPTAACRSIFLAATDNGALAYPTNFCTLVRGVVYGLCNVGQVKPAAAVYVDSIPTDPLLLFP